MTNAGNDPIASARIVEHVIFRRGGFSMIAYSYLLHPDGTILEGRSSDYRNGANRNDKGGRYANSNTVSVCCIGDYRTDKITHKQQQTFARLMSDLRRDGIITVDAELLAHRDLAYTQCPAGAYDQLLT
ncbi:MAG: peptidoglycan recognition protein family protein, partial [Acidimicrobiales bacterium]